MKKIMPIVVWLIIGYRGMAQFPTKEIWDRRFGGTGDEDLATFLQTKNGGYLLCGSSNSIISGDKTQTGWGDYDYWIIAIDSNGNKLWDHDYGGNGFEALQYAIPTQDGGYMLGGYSSSGISGDKTQPCWGDYDYWIVKIDSAGNKQWDKRYGGIGREILFGLEQTRDGGYVLAGVSRSGISGDRTQANWDTTDATNDIWVVKIDSVGNKQWDRRYGSSSSEGGGTLLQIKDGGYILLAETSSDSINGDVSQPTFRGYDYWIVKIDSVGNKLWDRRYGGDGWDFGVNILATKNDEYILGGYSSSDSSGNKSEGTCGDYDYWMVKIDSAGNKIWDKDFGGNTTEQLYSLTQTSDKGFLLAGGSGSHTSCDKTEYPAAQNWLLKTDSMGNKEWDKTIFTNGWDMQGYALQTPEGCYVIANATFAGIGGYKTQPNWDASGQTEDFWIVKFCYNGIAEGVEALTDKPQLNVYPNPFNSELDITLTQQNLHAATFNLTNILGQQIYTQQETNLSSTYTKMLNLSYLPNGVYILSVVVDGERVVTEVVKQ